MPCGLMFSLESRTIHESAIEALCLRLELKITCSGLSFVLLDFTFPLWKTSFVSS